MHSAKSEEKIIRKSEVFHYSGDFPLECGGRLKGFDIAYTTYGRYSNINNVVWVFHALTGNAEPEKWWQGVLGPGSFFDPEKYFIICANVLGSCYGSTGPGSINPSTEKPFGGDFPVVSIKDMVAAHQLLKRYIGIEKIAIGIGGSLGGQQLIEWASQEPDLFGLIIPVATNAQHSPWGIAFNEAQRMALTADASFFDPSYNGGEAGLQAARAIAMLSYRTQEIYNRTQSDNYAVFNQPKAATYQQYQGFKLSRRFNAYSYYYLTKAMDSHNIGRGGISPENALQLINSKALVVGIESDLLFPVAEQERINKNMKNSKLVIIQSEYGHDGFLVETEKINKILNEFIK